MNLSKTYYWLNSLPKIPFHDNRRKLRAHYFLQVDPSWSARDFISRTISASFQSHLWIQKPSGCRCSEVEGTAMKLGSPFLGMDKKQHGWHDVMANVAMSPSVGNLYVGPFRKCTLSNTSCLAYINFLSHCIGHNT